MKYVLGFSACGGLCDESQVTTATKGGVAVKCLV